MSAKSATIVAKSAKSTKKPGTQDYRPKTGEFRTENSGLGDSDVTPPHFKFSIAGRDSRDTNDERRPWLLDFSCSRPLHAADDNPLDIRVHQGLTVVTEGVVNGAALAVVGGEQ